MVFCVRANRTERCLKKDSMVSTEPLDGVEVESVYVIYTIDDVLSTWLDFSFIPKHFGGHEMSETREVRKITRTTPTIEGAGVHLQRVFGFGQEESFDPFLLLDHFGSDDPDDYRRGFPWHPHRGMETITYILRGNVEHGDSLGNKGVIGSGDVQWMTAGSGIIHQEMPKGDDSGGMWGFQLWANLPRSHKMMKPTVPGIEGGTDSGGGTT